jgi:hypothetical protein
MRNTLYGADKATRLQARALFIPKGAKLVPGPAGCAVYTYQTLNVFYAIAFRGSAAKSSFHHSYRTEQQRAEHIAAFFESVTGSLKYKAERTNEKKAWTNPAKVGDILYTSWGYDQTNVDFFAVTKVSGKRVWVREIAQDSEATGFMQEKCWPAMPIRFVGEETMHVAQMCGEKGYSVKISKSATAWLEMGREHYSSSYA